MDTEVAMSVYAVDLTRLSSLLAIPERELVTGFHAHASAADIQGVVVEAGEDVAFEAIGRIAEDEEFGTTKISQDTLDATNYTSFQPKPITTQVLITAATRATSNWLDEDTMLPTPKCLMQLGSQPIISHILTQLFTAGIQRIVILVAYAGDKIIQTVQEHPFYDKLTIEFIDLGRETTVSHAESILAAKDYFIGNDQPFIIHMADHIFEKAIISEFMNYSLDTAKVCALIEKDMANLVELSATAVKVYWEEDIINNKNTIVSISRDLSSGEFNGVEAGLFVSSNELFTILHDLSLRQSYFSLADALSDFAFSEKLSFIPTEGKIWFSVETKEQLAYTKDHQGESVLSPWTVFLAHTANVSDKKDNHVENSGESHARTLVMGVSTCGDDAASMRVTGYANDPSRFEGFIVGVNNAAEENQPIHPAALNVAIELSDFQKLSRRLTSPNEKTALLHDRNQRPHSFLNTLKSPFSRSVRASRNSYSSHTTGIGAFDEPFVLSFPVSSTSHPSTPAGSVENQSFSVSGSHQAYLIEMNDPNVNPKIHTPHSVSSSSHQHPSQYMLAFPGAEYDEDPHEKSQDFEFFPMLRTISMLAKSEIELPSDIQNISLTTTKTMDKKKHEESLHVTLVVERHVPVIGYLLLGLSLCAISCVGVFLDMETHVDVPLLKLFWRFTTTTFITLPLAFLSFRVHGVPKLDKNDLSRLLLAGCSYSFYLGCFVTSLAYTSVGHATLFNNAHSLVIVIVKILTRQPIGSFEGFGTIVGIVGGAIAATDTPSHAASANIIQPTAFGDSIALIGALGGATYFIQAKMLRSRMDIVVFMHYLSFISALCLLLPLNILYGHIITWDFNINHGLLGWLNPVSNRLVLSLVLVFLCDLTGTMGYISVMKYFDPIVISVLSLCEPLIATAVGILVGVDSVPHLQTLIGAALVIAGTTCVITSSQNKTDKVDATDALVIETSIVDKDDKYSSILRTPTPRLLNRSRSTSTKSQPSPVVSKTRLRHLTPRRTAVGS